MDHQITNARRALHRVLKRGKRFEAHLSDKPRPPYGEQEYRLLQRQNKLLARFLKVTDGRCHRNENETTAILNDLEILRRDWMQFKERWTRRLRQDGHSAWSGGPVEHR